MIYREHEIKSQKQTKLGAQGHDRVYPSRIHTGISLDRLDLHNINLKGSFTLQVYCKCNLNVSAFSEIKLFNQYFNLPLFHFEFSEITPPLILWVGFVKQPEPLTYGGDF
jgi:hypothetical protein